MDSPLNNEYSKLHHLHFAVWNMIKPINFIWVDFDEQCVRCGVKNEPDDPIAAMREEEAAKDEVFVELISYDDDGMPVLGFDPKESEKPYTEYPAQSDDLVAFLCDLQELDILSWRNQFPSLREGLCWRIDIYYDEKGEKHMSGQTRFPPDWAAFGKSLNALVEKVQKDSEQ
ncbi:MAG: hypothetical protein J6L81_03865 [Clostridia bacterium]|nr:hypothetical protein [Clostridia bacterium]